MQLKQVLIIYGLINGVLIAFGILAAIQNNQFLLQAMIVLLMMVLPTSSSWLANQWRKTRTR